MVSQDFWSNIRYAYPLDSVETYHCLSPIHRCPSTYVLRSRGKSQAGFPCHDLSLLAFDTSSYSMKMNTHQMWLLFCKDRFPFQLLIPTQLNHGGWFSKVVYYNSYLICYIVCTHVIVFRVMSHPAWGHSMPFVDRQRKAVSHSKRLSPLDSSVEKITAHLHRWLVKMPCISTPRLLFAAWLPTAVPTMSLSTQHGSLDNGG